MGRVEINFSTTSLWLTNISCPRWWLEETRYGLRCVAEPVQTDWVSHGDVGISLDMISSRPLCPSILHKKNDGSLRTAISFSPNASLLLTSKCQIMNRPILVTLKVRVWGVSFNRLLVGTQTLRSNGCLSLRSWRQRRCELISDFVLPITTLRDGLNTTSRQE